MRSLPCGPCHPSEHERCLCLLKYRFTCQSVLSAMWLCKSVHFHSCCSSPVLNILLEISWKVLWIAIHVCNFKYIWNELWTQKFARNIKQCYLLADNMHSHKMWSSHVHPTSRPVSALFPHNWVRKCIDFLWTLSDYTQRTKQYTKFYIIISLFLWEIIKIFLREINPMSPV
jgi:hypothetical protein